MNTLYELKEKALSELSAVPMEIFEPEKAIRQRIDYIKDLVLKTGQKKVVLGISGGVDSSTAGKLAQMAMDELKTEKNDASYEFIGVRLPAHVQKDEDEAQESMAFINPDRTLTVDVGPTSDTLASSVDAALKNSTITDDELVHSMDFCKGNIKARMRMASQYAIAGFVGGLVLGTDHNAEAVIGFFTKGGDGFCDFIVLNGMNKRQVRLCAQTLGAPEHIHQKQATADLEEDRPQLADEEAIGVSYDEIDDFLEGKPVSEYAEGVILSHFSKTIHKREQPVGFE